MGGTASPGGCGLPVCGAGFAPGKQPVQNSGAAARYAPPFWRELKGMIRKIAAACAAAFSLGLVGTACAAPASSVPTPQVAIIQNNSGVPLSAPPAAETQPLHFVDTSYGAGDEEGFYEAQAVEGGNFGIAYTDYATQRQTMLCYEPGCAHNTDACPAWLGSENIKPSMLLYGEKLVVVYPGNPLQNANVPDEALQEHASLVLFNKTGGGRQNFATLPGNQRFTGNMAADGSALYSMAEVWNLETLLVSEKQLLRIDMQSGEVTTLATYPANENATLDGVADGKLLISKAVGPVAGTTKAERQEALTVPIQYEIHRVSTADGRAELFKSWQQGQYAHGILDGTVYLASPEGNISAVDGATGEERALAEGVEGVDVESTTFRLVQGERLVFTVVHTATDGVSVLRERFCLNTETGEVWQLTLSTEYGGAVNPVTILAETEDSFLVISELINGKTGTNEPPASYEDHASIILETRSLVSKEAYFGSEQSYRVVSAQMGQNPDVMPERDEEEAPSEETAPESASSTDGQLQQVG